MRHPLIRGLTAAAAVTLVGSLGLAAAANNASAAEAPAAPAAKVDNPYSGAKGYVNPEWKAKAESVSGGSRVSNNPTAVWLDRIAAIEGTSDSSSNGSMGLADHLDAAVSQGAGYIQLVIYDLPGRDCSALASNGELGPDDIDRYKSEYIDPIAAIEGNAKYASLRIINIVEIDSLPNLVTNTGGQAGATAMCDTMKANGNYINGIGYALQKLGAIGNVYNYVDAAHHGWIGWDTNFAPTAQIMLQAAQKSGSVNNVTGFITNTANYSALSEPYITINTTVGGQSIRQSKWIDWNQYVDELTFAQAFRTQLVSAGFPSNIGMLIDTSRNGWGGSSRPTKASTSTDINTFVNESRIDRRIHAGNWCNQSGAGLGERPKAAPATGIDAYVWVKPPGESDGSSSLIPNDEGKGFDQMCDPSYGGNARNGNNKTGAMSGAPISGAWFAAQFQELMQNAYPPLS
jgi:cellulose 1,4-beta-cellobiosidase